MPDSRYACIIFDLAKIVLDSEEWEDAVWSLKFLISCGYKIKISLAIGSLDMRDFEPVELISPDGVNYPHPKECELLVFASSV